MSGFGHCLCLVLLLFALRSDFTAHINDTDGTVSSNLTYFLDQVFMEIHPWDIIETIPSTFLELSTPEKWVLIFEVFLAAQAALDLCLVWKVDTACICPKWGSSLLSPASQDGVSTHSLPLGTNLIKNFSCKELHSTFCFCTVAIKKKYLEPKLFNKQLDQFLYLLPLFLERLRHTPNSLNWVLGESEYSFLNVKKASAWKSRWTGQNVLSRVLLLHVRNYC